jgi:hypothetical protein
MRISVSTLSKLLLCNTTMTGMWWVLLCFITSQLVVLYPGYRPMLMLMYVLLLIVWHTVIGILGIQTVDSSNAVPLLIYFQAVFVIPISCYVAWICHDFYECMRLGWPSVENILSPQLFGDHTIICKSYYLVYFQTIIGVVIFVMLNIGIVIICKMAHLLIRHDDAVPMEKATV